MGRDRVALVGRAVSDSFVVYFWRCDSWYVKWAGGAGRQSSFFCICWMGTDLLARPRGDFCRMVGRAVGA